MVRQRGENWCKEEKDLFLKIMRKSALIIENKQTDTNSNKRKNLEWLKVQTKFQELTGKSRDIVQLKGFWRRTKLEVKKNVSKHKRAVRITGGGQRPSSSLDDLIILDLDTDFVKDDNDFDSEGIFMNTDKEVKSNPNVINNSNTIFDIENEDPKQLDDPLEDDITISVKNEEVFIETGTKNNIPIHQENDAKAFNAEKKTQEKTKLHKTETSHKDMIVSSNIDLKQRTRELMEEEHTIKMEYHRKELQLQELRQKSEQEEHHYQEQRRKLEIDLLLLEKSKKLLEIDILKKSLL